MWGSKSDRYAQTSRPSVNLVLRLNFNHQHDSLLQKLIHPTRDGVFNYWGHPVLGRGDRSYYRETLAWYHSWKVGNYLKRINGHYLPPKSLYSALPRQFCFEQTEQLPGMLSDRRTIKRLRRGKIKPLFYKLEL
ncbi:MAG: hypothetical protein AB2536_19860 [Candidatus Thiodiazotropha endolucinida]